MQKVVFVYRGTDFINIKVRIRFPGIPLMGMPGTLQSEVSNV